MERWEKAQSVIAGLLIPAGVSLILGMLVNTKIPLPGLTWSGIILCLIWVFVGNTMVFLNATSERVLYLKSTGMWLVEIFLAGYIAWYVFENKILVVTFSFFSFVVILLWHKFLGVIADTYYDDSRDTVTPSENPGGNNTTTTEEVGLTAEFTSQGQGKKGKLDLTELFGSEQRRLNLLQLELEKKGEELKQERIKNILDLLTKKMISQTDAVVALREVDPNSPLIAPLESTNEPPKVEKSKRIFGGKGLFNNQEEGKQWWS